MSENPFFVHPSAIVDAGAVILPGAKIWHFCHILAGCEIGEDCSIGQNCVIFPQVKLGKNVKVQNNVSIYEGVICEEDVFLGPSMVFTNVLNPRSAINRKGQYNRTLVKKGASIGANATIVCGTTLGKYAFVGAGAVVTKDVPDYALVVGNPARQIGWMSEFGQRLYFDEAGTAICSESNQKYIIKESHVFRIED